MANSGGASDMMTHFQTGMDVLKRHPVMIIPPLAVQIVMAVLTFLFIGGAATAIAVGGGAGLIGAIMGGFVFTLLTGILSLIASGVTVVMARDALATREPSMGDALGTVMGRLVDVLIASILVMIIVGIGMVLFVLPGVVAAFFLIFTLPAVLLDNVAAIEGIKRSVRLVKDNVVPVLLFLIGCVVAGIVLAIVAKLIGFIPLIGQLAVAVLAGIAIAYFSIVAVRVYQTLPVR
jgi:hypothetical protein